ncbi:MAG: SCO family protein [Pirellulaceae bacterium]
MNDQRLSSGLHQFIRVLVFVALLGVAVRPLQAQLQDPAGNLFESVGVEPKLGASLPLDITFQDEQGHGVDLRSVIRDKPVVLNLVYFECPMLCNLTMNNFIRTLRTMRMNVGSEFDVVTISFDPRETPAMSASAKRTALQRYGRGESANGWHFLTGEQNSIEKLTAAVGFRYQYDPINGQYAHPSTLIVITPDGRVSRYLPGVEFPARDLRLSVVEASDGGIATISDHITLLCYAYNPHTGRYNMAVQRIIRVTGLFTVSAILGAMVIMLRHDRLRRATQVEEKTNGT